MKKILLFLLLVIVAFAAYYLVSKKVNSIDSLKKALFESTHDRDKVAEQEAFDVAYNAYIFGFVRVKGMLLQDQATHPKYFNYAPINQFFINKELAKPGFTDFTPNSDTYYGLAWLDLSQGPIVMTIPEIPDRYFTIEGTDASLNVISNICSRLKSAPGVYVYCKNDYTGALPTGANRINSETNQVFLQLRVLALNRDDMKERDYIYNLCKRYTIEPLNKEAKYTAIDPNSPITNPKNTNPELQDWRFYKLLNRALTESPASESEKALVAQFAKLNIGSKMVFDPEKLTKAQQKGVKDGQLTALRKLYDELKFGGERIGGFNFRHDLGIYSGGFNYALKSALAFYAYGGNVPEEATYVNTLFDKDGNELEGGNKYKVHFEKDQIPPVNAFWSLTMYDLPESQLIENEINRYNIGGYTPNLKYNADGSLDVLVQNERPADITNWLPAPKGKFWIVLRLYNPKPIVLEHKYAPPFVVKY